MMPTICRDTVVIISVMFLEIRKTISYSIIIMWCVYVQVKPLKAKSKQECIRNTYGSVCVHSKLGPRTMAMFPEVILFES